MLYAGNNTPPADRVYPVSSGHSIPDYKVIPARFLAGNLILNFVFLHAGLSARPYMEPYSREAIKEVIDLRDVMATVQF